MSKNIVILGASFAGLQLAHRLIKSLPADHRLVIVSPSTHVYWNIAAPRVFGSPGALKDESYLLQWLPSFSSYPEGSMQFIQGKATALKPESNTVVVQTLDDSHPEGTGEQEIAYEHIIVATGSTSHGEWPFKSSAPYPQTVVAIEKAQKAIANAGKIVISGAGPTGVETAGEIKSQYPEKLVYIVTTGETTLPMMKENVGAAADRTLKKLGIGIRPNTKVVSEEPEETGNGLVLKLANGETINCDLHIPAHITRPNNEFLPKELLNEEGWLMIDANLKSPKYSNIWGLGDITDFGIRKSLVIGPALPSVTNNILAAIKGADLKPHEWAKDMGAIVPIGPKFGNGTGSLFGWKVPGVFAWFIKGRDMMVSMAPTLMKKA